MPSVVTWQAGGWRGWNPGKSTGTVAPGLPPLCWEAASLPGIGFRAGAGRNVRGAKQAQGWVPTSGASLGGGGCAWAVRAGGVRTGPRDPLQSFGDPLHFRPCQLSPGDPLDPCLPAPPSIPPYPGCSHSTALQLLPHLPPPRGPSLSAPAGLLSLETSARGLALFTAAASSSFQ